MVSRWRGVPIQKIVANEKWQRLRKSFLGTWMKQPQTNVMKLRQYLDEEQWREYPMVRVYNYLTGTAFRMGKISHPSIDRLKNEVDRRLHQEHKK